MTEVLPDQVPFCKERWELPERAQLMVDAARRLGLSAELMHPINKPNGFNVAMWGLVEPGFTIGDIYDKMHAITRERETITNVSLNLAKELARLSLIQSSL